jgi:hypothetical protein
MEKVEERTRKVAIFIDLPNLIHSAEQFGYEVNKFLDLTKQYGEIQEGYAYCNFIKDRINFSIQHALVSQNIKIIHCPASSIKGETKIDDLMLIEGIHDSLRKNADVFYIFVTSDIMILPVSMTLRSLGRDFKIYGFSQCASSLLKVLPEFMDLGSFLKKENEAYGKANS